MSVAANVATETLRKDGEFTVLRATTAVGSASRIVILPTLERPSSTTLGKLHNAFALRGDLDESWSTRPLELTEFSGRPALVLHDPGGELLERRLGKPLPLTDFLRLAIAAATALSGLHQQGLVHKDVSPASLIVDANGEQVWLTGFSWTSRLSRNRQTAETSAMITGTLAYMAPEQTGRMNRSVDARSDLYALGVTLYELLVGELPFQACGAIEWIHCHIARMPAPPHLRRNDLPVQLSAVIMTLLAKAPEDRYQSAVGLACDLQRCLDALIAGRLIEDFPVGMRDTADRLSIPEKLYGREAETQLLLAAFDRIVRHGGTELVLVSGYPGVGKSSVVHELHKAMVPAHGLFASGKFDQYKRDIPYATLAPAFQGLVRQILTQRDQEMLRWRATLVEALGSNAQLIVSLIPELEFVIGPQLPVADLSPQEMKHRFQRVLIRFVGVFARSSHPLVLFIDDLQWLDRATLDLLEGLLTDSEPRSLLLVGAYRDNEVDAAHPLSRTLSAVKAAGGQVQAITLHPLELGDVQRLIGDAIRTDPQDVRGLAELVFAKTGGNPFFTVQFLQTLEEEQLLTFDTRRSAWAWDLQRIRAMRYSDNVADLMAAKLDRSPAATREAMAKLALIGNVVDLRTLTTAYGGSEEDVHSALSSAVTTGLVFRTESAYSFVHDRVQEAAYALTPVAERAEAHLAIGRKLLQRVSQGRLEEEIFEVLNQMNRGAALVTAAEERRQLAELNLMAGQRAKKATAYLSALNYLRAGSAMLPIDPGIDTHRLAFRLELNQAECEFLTGNQAASRRLVELSRRAQTLQDAAAVTCLQQALYTTFDRLDLSVQAGLAYLDRVGIKWTAQPSPAEADAECRRMWALLEGRSIEAMAGLSLISDADLSATVDVLTDLAPAAYFTDVELFCLINFRVVNLSLEHGNSPGSAVAYALAGFLMGSRFNDHAAGFRFGQLAMALVEKPGLDRFKARVLLNFAYCVNPWSRPIRTGRPLLRESFSIARETGDLQFAGFTFYCLVTDLIACGEPLVEAQREAEAGLLFTRDARFGLVVAILTGHLRFILTMRGLTPDFGSFSDAEFFEDRFEEQLAADTRLSNPTCIYWIRKLQARFFSGDYVAALQAAQKAEALLWTQRSSFELVEYQFYLALARARHHADATPDEQTQLLEALLKHRDVLAAWAMNCACNFADRVALIEAEIARIEGRDWEALCSYERAIQLAREQGFVHNEGLALELAAAFHAARGLIASAQSLLRDARSCYERWGADGKVKQLDQHHPSLRVSSLHTQGAGATPDQFDLTSIAKMTQTVTEEVVLSRAIEKLLIIAVENAGADRGHLITAQGDELRSEAEATAQREGVIVGLRQMTTTPEEIPETVLRYVLRSHNSVILEDAWTPNLFSDDTYLLRERPRSILCLPLFKQKDMTGLLYLENRMAAHVFSPARMSLLKLLAAQAAISLQNARLYTDLERENAERKKAVEALRRSEALLVEGQRISQTGSWEWNVPTGRVIWSDESYRIFGYEPQSVEVNLELFLTRIHPEDVTELKLSLEEFWREGTPIDSEYRLLLPDGTVKYVLSRGHRSSGDSGPASDYIGTNQDITERRLAAEALRAAEHLARGQLEALTQTMDSLAKESDSDRMLEQVLRTICQRLQGHSIGVWEVCPDAQESELIGLFEQDKLACVGSREHGSSRADSLSRLDHPLWTGFLRRGAYCVASEAPGDELHLWAVDGSTQHWHSPPTALRTLVDSPMSSARLRSKGITAALAAPMFVEGKVKGFLAIHFEKGRSHRREEVELARALANQAMLALQLQRLTAQSRQTAVLEERARMARDIHDTLAQGFTSVIVQLEAAQDASSLGLTDEASSHIVRAGNMARYGLSEARRSVQALRLKALDDSDFCSALRNLVQTMTANTGMHSEVALVGEPRAIPPHWEDNLLRISQEVVTNALRHARASQFEVRLIFDRLALQLELRDDGVGFDPARRQDGFGIIGMKERIAQMQGKITILSAPAEGTAVLISMPLTASPGSTAT